MSEYALIGSGALVIKDIKAYALVVDNLGHIVAEVDKKKNKDEMNFQFV